MQAGGATLEQAFAQFGDDVEAESADRIDIVAVALELLAHPARHFGAAGIREARQFGEAGDRHDAGNNRHIDAKRRGFVDEIEVSIGVVEILGDG